MLKKPSERKTLRRFSLVFGLNIENNRLYVYNSKTAPPDV